MTARSVASSWVYACPMHRLESPGETPQSTTAVTPCCLASPSSSMASSGMNEMSQYGVPVSITAASVCRPMRLGSAPSATSYSLTADRTWSGSPRSICRVAIGARVASLLRVSGLTSAAVTANSGSPAMSRTIALPTSPHPSTIAFFCITRSQETTKSNNRAARSRATRRAWARRGRAASAYCFPRPTPPSPIWRGCEACPRRSRAERRRDTPEAGSGTTVTNGWIHSGTSGT